MYDAIVVGARCAGASTAMLLARRGHKVLLVDRAAFPSDLPHGHFIHRHGPRRLHAWGLLDRVTARGCPAVTTMTTDFGDYAMTGHDLAVDGVALGYGPRRAALDAMLVEAAVEAGAELRTGFAVDDYVTDDGRVVGVRGRDRRGGREATERATITVGADGRHSRLARAVNAAEYESAPTATCWYFSYWSGVAHEGLGVYLRGDRVIMVFPTNDGLTAVFVAWGASELPRVRADVAGAFDEALAKVPALAERVRAGRREERFAGATDLRNFLRVPHGPGWALVGDAGCHKDPYLALGICDAFRDAELLADAVDAGLAGRAPMDVALAGYQRARDSATLPDYRQNLQSARLGPPPMDVLQLRGALRGRQDDIARFYLAYQGMVPPQSFFNPENLGRLTAAR
jgi:flavin-dependent dehydrogenase